MILMPTQKCNLILKCSILIMELMSLMLQKIEERSGPQLSGRVLDSGSRGCGVETRIEQDTLILA